METKTFTPYLVVIALLVLTSVALALSVDVRISDQAGIKVFLPDQVGDWVGRELRFCQNPVCQKEFVIGDTLDRNVCPKCGGALASMTLAEKDLLPGDTEILKKMYTNPGKKVLQVSIVMSGKERASIHRPQVCLVGQGNNIDRSTVMSVPIEGRTPLKIMDLDLTRTARMPDGKTVRFPGFYVYWFVGKGRETPYHTQRMVWMATDRIFKNVSHRWAYISVAGALRQENENYREEVNAFIHDLYPQMVIDNKSS